MNKPYNTRVAPSPTGFFHLGTARTAYHNWLAAKASGGKFLLRIDDTDTSRNNDLYVDVIYQAMSWLGLDWDHDFLQSSRMTHYRDIAYHLVDKGLARYDQAAIRLNSDFFMDSWRDFYGKDNGVSANDRQIANNLVIIKSDGMATYHFASIVDDIDHNINLIIRGADHISNTVKQLFILKALHAVGYTAGDMDFTHVGLILNQGKKMSKRDGDANLLGYKDQAFCADAILNFILKLGWAHPDAQFDSKFPLIDKKLAQQVFFDGKLKAGNCSFDRNKLIWLNKKYTAK